MIHWTALPIQSQHAPPGRKRSRSSRQASVMRLTSSGVPQIPIATRQETLLDQFLDRDQLYKASVAAAASWQKNLLKKNDLHLKACSDVSGPGWGNQKEARSCAKACQRARDLNVPALWGQPLTISIPESAGQLASKELKGLGTRKRDSAFQAEQIDELVPIRLDIEWDHLRLRDTFTWNLHERVIGIDAFARQMTGDLGLSLSSQQIDTLERRIASAMSEHVTDFHPHIFIEEDALDPHLPYSAYKNDEMRIVIKLNVTIGQYTLIDQFEWDINNPLNVPEEFAKQMAWELSLSGEFTTAIAHCIREQSQLYTQSLYVVGHPFDGRPLEDHELLASFQSSPLPSAFRPYQAAKEFTPCLYELNDAELEKTELSLSREERRQKRSINRRGGPALPDLKDRRRTIRSLLVSSVLPGAASSIQESRILKGAVGSGKVRKDRGREGLDDFDDSDSEESVFDFAATATSHYAGIPRTRGVRGAASAAQAAMRHTLGRSATPEANTFHHHETRASGRRVGRDESTPEPQGGLLVVLRLDSAKLRQLRDHNSRGKDVVSRGEEGKSTRHNLTGPSHGFQHSVGPTSVNLKSNPGSSTFPTSVFLPLARPAASPPSPATQYLGRAGITARPGHDA